MAKRSPKEAWDTRWSRRWGLNPRPPLYESGALPLSYFGLVAEHSKQPSCRWRGVSTLSGSAQLALLLVGLYEIHDLRTFEVVNLVLGR